MSEIEPITPVDPPSPLERAIFEYGGKTKMAKALEVSRNTIWVWEKKGEIPPKYWRKMRGHREIYGLRIDKSLTGDDEIG